MSIGAVDGRKSHTGVAPTKKFKDYFETVLHKLIDAGLPWELVPRRLVGA